MRKNTADQNKNKDFARLVKRIVRYQNLIITIRRKKVMKINKNIMCTVLSFGLIASLGSGMAVKAEGEYQTTGDQL